MRTGESTSAALGFRAHSGWAALIAVGGEIKAPRVIERQRVELADPMNPHARQPFHAAEPLEFAKAEKLVNGCIASSRKLALQAVESAIAELKEKNCAVAGCGILVASGRQLPELRAVLASHALIHAAEGEMFREVLIQAGQHHHLPVVQIKERELFDKASSTLGLSRSALQQYLQTAGKELGPPWRQDEKFATLAAWIALASASEPAKKARVSG